MDSFTDSGGAMPDGGDGDGVTGSSSTVWIFLAVIITASAAWSFRGEIANFLGMGSSNADGTKQFPFTVKK